MRILIAAWAGSTNLGDELVLAGLLRRLSDRGVEAEVISVNPEETSRTHGVAAVSHGDPAALWGAVGRADAMLLGGGGLVQDETSSFNLPYHLSRPWLARLRGRPWAGIGLGVGPLETGIGRRLARTMTSATVVGVRDAASADLLRGVGVGEVVVAADLALALDLPDEEPEDRIVVSLRPWTPGRGRAPVATSRRRVKVPAWFDDALPAALDRAAAETGLGVRFVAFQADRDGPLHEHVAGRMRADVELISPGVYEVVREVARGRIVIGMRYHAGITAVLAGRPAVLIDYSPKVANLASDLEPYGGGLVALDFSAAAFTGIPAALEKVARRHEAIAEGREALRARERRNTEVLDRLLAAAVS